MEIDEALDDLGPIRAVRRTYYVSGGKVWQYDTPRFWLDGRRVATAKVVIQAANDLLKAKRKAERKRAGVE